MEDGAGLPLLELYDINLISILCLLFIFYLLIALKNKNEYV